MCYVRLRETVESVAPVAGVAAWLIASNDGAEPWLVDSNDGVVAWLVASNDGLAVSASKAALACRSSDLIELSVCLLRAVSRVSYSSPMCPLHVSA